MPCSAVLPEVVHMDTVENIALIVVLMLLGIGVMWALLAGFIYYLEAFDDER